MKRSILWILGAAATAAALLWVGPRFGAERPIPRRVAAGAGPVAVADPLSGQITQERGWLTQHPDDASAWAVLGAAYVEQARITTDPTYLTKADGAIRRAQALPGATGQTAVSDSLAVLDAARHRFAEAHRLAEQAVARQPDDWTALGVLADADTQLGRYDDARAESQQMMDAHPGVPAYTRAARYFVLVGDVPQAEHALALAVSASTAPADIAFCYQQKADLEWQHGRLAASLTDYDLALRADPGFAPALAGRGRTRAALGQIQAGVDDYRQAISRAPYPPLILELGDLYTSLGRHAEADQQFAVFQAEQKLYAAAGVGAADIGDLLLAGQYLADHGDPAQAVSVLRRWWAQTPGVDTADALAWALHRTGHDAEALPLAEQATHLPGFKALYAFHRGEIERALGHRDQARADLTEALHRNPYFSPLWAPMARADLAAL